MSIFEALMLISFGAAWPASIIKSWKSGTAKGKSLTFMIIIDFGYLAGIMHKILYNPDFIIVFYILNFLMVSADMAIYFRNRRFDAANLAASGQ